MHEFHLILHKCIHAHTQTQIAIHTHIDPNSHTHTHTPPNRTMKSLSPLSTSIPSFPQTRKEKRNSPNLSKGPKDLIKETERADKEGEKESERKKRASMSWRVSSSLTHSLAWPVL